MKKKALSERESKYMPGFDNNKRRAVKRGKY